MNIKSKIQEITTKEWNTPYSLRHPLGADKLKLMVKELEAIICTLEAKLNDYEDDIDKYYHMSMDLEFIKEICDKMMNAPEYMVQVSDVCNFLIKYWEDIKDKKELKRLIKVIG